MLRNQGILDTLSEEKQESFGNLETRISNNRDKITKIQNFFTGSRNVLGLVYAGSGLQTTKTTRTLDGESYPTGRDWAIIKVDENRPVTNRVRHPSISGRR